MKELKKHKDRLGVQSYEDCHKVKLKDALEN